MLAAGAATLLALASPAPSAATDTATGSGGRETPPAATGASDPHGAHRLTPRTAPRDEVLAPGYGRLEFEAPTPGSYRLPPFGEAADGTVLRTDGEATTLHALMGDRLVVLSFIYTRCPDPNGCPLATHVLRRLQRHIAATPALQGEVRFLSLSFDPAYDTPAVMREYEENVAGEAGAASSAVPWLFLTTKSTDALAPILDDYDQVVIQARDESGEPVGSYSHILRVYLIDRERRIRNIYSVPFLHPDLLAADLLTLLGERANEATARAGPPPPPQP